MVSRTKGDKYFQHSMQKKLGRVSVINSISLANLESKFKNVKSITLLLCLL